MSSLYLSSPSSWSSATRQAEEDGSLWVEDGSWRQSEPYTKRGEAACDLTLPPPEMSRVCTSGGKCFGERLIAGPEDSAEEAHLIPFLSLWCNTSSEHTCHVYFPQVRRLLTQCRVVLLTLEAKQMVLPPSKQAAIW